MSDNSSATESRVEFHGPGPFDLPVAQQVSADPVANTVVLSFRILARSKELEVVRIAVLSNQALELAAQMRAAAIEASGEDK